MRNWCDHTGRVVWALQRGVEGCCWSQPRRYCATAVCPRNANRVFGPRQAGNARTERLCFFRPASCRPLHRLGCRLTGRWRSPTCCSPHASITSQRRPHWPSAESYPRHRSPTPIRPCSSFSSSLSNPCLPFLLFFQPPSSSCEGKLSHLQVADRSWMTV
jgi:hypothetical protein